MLPWKGATLMESAARRVFLAVRSAISGADAPIPLKLFKMHDLFSSGAR